MRTARRARSAGALHRHNVLTVIGSFTALVLLITGCDRATDTPRSAVSVGAPAPAFATFTLDGTPVSLAEHRGSVVLVNIWATWCKPCREEIPALESLFQRYGSRGFFIAGVSIDQPGETERIARFASDLGATYPLWHDADDKVSTTFLAIGVPASYLIDRAGILRWRHVGPVKADDAALITALETALGTAPADSATASGAVAPIS